MWPFKKHAPEIETRSHSTLFFRTGNGQGTHWNTEAYAREGYVQNVVANACIRLIASSAASVELQLEKGPKGKIVDAHPLLDLITAPNGLMVGAEFIEALIAHRLIFGNAYVTRLPAAYGRSSGRAPKELWLLSPPQVTVKHGERGLPIAYEYRRGGNQAETYTVNPVTGECDLVHFRTFNPLSLYNGMPSMAPAALAIDTHTAALRWNKGLLDNAALPSGALVMGGKDGNDTLTDEQFAKLKLQLEENMSGAQNARKPLLLEGGLDWKSMGLSPTDMDFDKGIWNAAIHTCMAFGVPPQMIGIPTSQTFANFEQANLTLWQSAVLPALNGTLATLNRWLAPMYGDPTLRLQPNEDTISALEPLRQIRFDRARLADYLTVDEKRELAGYGPLTDGAGDVVLVNASQMPLDMLGADLTETLPDPADAADTAEA